MAGLMHGRLAGMRSLMLILLKNVRRSTTWVKSMYKQQYPLSLYFLENFRVDYVNAEFRYVLLSG